MKRILLIILLLSIYVFVNAQYENILISNTAGPNEPSISMDPNNPMHLVAGANTDKYFISNEVSGTLRASSQFRQLQRVQEGTGEYQTGPYHH